MKKRWLRRTPPEPGTMPPHLVAWAQAVDVSRLSQRTVKEAEDYLREYRRMNAFARHEVAFRLTSAVETQVSPPPPADVAPLDILATVLAVRRKQLGIG